ncbi:MAG: M1 family aminopeptidase [Bacteroidales bacterium]
MRLYLFVILAFLKVGSTNAQEQLSQDDLFSVYKYRIAIEINDTTNAIKAIAEIKVSLVNQTDSITLDLVTKGDEEGMIVDSVLLNGKRIGFSHRNNRLTLPGSGSDDNSPGSHSKYVNYDVHYHGIPADGLIISSNMHGNRTFFTDNWPNRAHNWFPCLDHPSKRSKIDFIITAPSHYQVIATGIKHRTVNLPGKRTTHYWASSVPVPAKVMAFAAAEFAHEYNDDIDGIPYSNWVYPQNMEEGFYDFNVTPEIFRFFTGTIGPYPFEKIANVQSTTRYGGMENAGNIFYHEKSITGKQSNKLTVVHEIAHQWFGNSVSESDWPHLWLSEGIATWLTDWYVEQNYGKEEYAKRLESHRKTIIDYAGKRLAPVVDLHVENYSDLLNPNSYQKGSWILHMLRLKIGEDNLLNGLVEFHEKYSMSHACTKAFMEVLEKTSGEDLEQFFDDWLYSAGHPVISLSSGFSNGRLNMELLQTQPHKMAFSFPLDVRFILADGTVKDQTFDIIFRRHEFLLDFPSEPVEIILDPEIRLLFEKK